MTKEALPHTPGRWRLIYFDAPTRGEQIRVLFALAGVAFDDVRVRPFPSGLDPYKKAALGEAECAMYEKGAFAVNAIGTLVFGGKATCGCRVVDDAKIAAAKAAADLATT